MNNEQKKSFLILTLGCKLNQLESEAITDAFIKADCSQFPALNFRLPAPGSQLPPSVVVINTCTVTSKADQKARRVIRKALRDYPDAGVIVTGCYAQLNEDDILALETDGKKRLHVVNKKDILNLPDYFNKLEMRNEEFPSFYSPLPTPHSQFQFNPNHFSAHTRSFLKIQDGCDRNCTYCRIRLARGPSVSLPAEEVLSRLLILEQNHAEAVLTGVNISQYMDRRFHAETQRHGGKEEKKFTTNQDELGLSEKNRNHGGHGVTRSFWFKNHLSSVKLRVLCGLNITYWTSPTRTEENKVFGLAELLDYLLSGTSKLAIRLSSLAPESVDEKLCAVLSHPRIRPHFHLSIQSCSEKILEKMGRNYNAQIIEKAVALLRAAKDDPFLACDIISGFPGETEAEFEQTFSLCQKLDFAWIHVFPYSKRPGTPAFSFADNVHESDVTKRVQRLTELAEQGKARYVERWIGREVEVLVEKEKNFTTNGICGSFTNKHKHNIFCYGTSENYLKVLVRCNGDEAPAPGDTLMCRLTEKGDGKDADVAGIL